MDCTSPTLGHKQNALPHSEYSFGLGKAEDSRKEVGRALKQNIL